MIKFCSLLGEKLSNKLATAILLLLICKWKLTLLVTHILHKLDNENNRKKTEYNAMLYDDVLCSGNRLLHAFLMNS